MTKPLTWFDSGGHLAVEVDGKIVTPEHVQLTRAKGGTLEVVAVLDGDQIVTAHLDPPKPEPAPLESAAASDPETVQSTGSVDGDIAAMFSHGFDVDVPRFARMADRGGERPAVQRVDGDGEGPVAKQIFEFFRGQGR